MPTTDDHRAAPPAPDADHAADGAEPAVPVAAPPAAAPRRRPSIRYRLALLVCACVLPAAMVSAYLIYDHYEVERGALLNEALSTGRAMAAVVDRDFDTVSTALRTLSASDDIVDDLVRFKRQAMQLHAIVPVSDIALVDPASGRQLMNSTVADGQPLPPVADPALVAQVVRLGQPAVSDLQRPTAASGGAPFLTVAVPVYRAGLLIRVLTAQLPPATLSAILTAQKLPDSWRASISDKNTVVVARNRDIGLYLGQPVAPELRRRLPLRAEDRFDSVTLDGLPVVTIFSRAPRSGWAVALGIPRHTLSASVARTLEALILATVLLLTAGLSMAWVVGGRIARSVQALIGPATALGNGAPVRVPRLDFKEAEQVADSLLLAAATLQAARDETARQSAERQRAQAALMAADVRKDEFLATLAHELRNPMAPLVNALEILRMGDERRAASRNVLDIMERQLKQMVHLIDDLLDVSRITTNKLSIQHAALTLQDVLMYAQETVAVLMSKRQHHLLLRLPPATVSLRGDATRLAQVFANLLNNAAKYTPPGGTIELSVATAGDQVVVTIRDSGIGIAPEVLPHIFEIFFQADQSLGRSQAGLGIGLPLARRLVQLHGGSLSVASAGLGQGSTVTVLLPVAEPATVVPAQAAMPAEPDTSPQHRLPPARRQAGGGERAGHAAPTAPPTSPAAATLSAPAVTLHAAPPAPPARTAPARPAHRVLLADDNVDNANTLKELLLAAGQQVQVSYDGLAALMTAESFLPQFAFLDIGMPGLDGYQLARQLRATAATSDCVLVAVTGWGQEKDQRLSREAGFDFHIVKPVRLEQLLEILALPGRPAP